MAQRTRQKQSKAFTADSISADQISLRGLDFDTAIRAAMQTGKAPPPLKAKRAKPKGKK